MVLMGLMTSQLQLAFAQAGPESAATGGARASKTAVYLTALQGSVLGLLPFITNCVPATAGTSPGPIAPIPSTPLLSGICSQNFIFGEIIFEQESHEAAKESLTFIEKLLALARVIAQQALKKLILDRLVDSLIAYISGQTDSIIEDWDEFFDQAADQAVGLVAQQLGAGFLCSNFDLNLRLTLLPVDQFSKGTTCSLTSIIGNIDSFIENFENGGWVGYQEQWYPQNNFYGGVLTALDEVSIQGAKARSAALTEGVTGGGFLSQKKCTDPNDPRTCSIVTPGHYIAGEVRTALGIDKDILGILTAADFDQYIISIVNAGINRLAKMGIDGLRGVLKKRTSDFTTTTPATPCAGLTGDAFRSCITYQQTISSSFQNDQFFALDQINASLLPRQQANEILNELVTNQTEFVDTLAALAACRPSDLNIQNQIATEQETLDELLNQTEDNLTFIEPLEQVANSVGGTGTNDWTALAELSTNAFDISDPGTASNFLGSVLESQSTVQINIDAKLPDIRNQLQSCSPSN